MSRGWNYKSGDWNAVCDSCGGKFKASQMKRRWDGFMVCKDDFEMRHPQDFLKARTDKISVPWSRPQLPVIFDEQLGLFDNVYITDSGLIFTVSNYEYYVDNITVTDLIEIRKYKGFTDSFDVTDVFQTVLVAAKEFNDIVVADDAPNSVVCRLDYIDPTYFLEIYVGTCSQFT